MIRKIEQGRSRFPRPETLAGLANALGVSHAELIATTTGQRPTGALRNPPEKIHLLMPGQPRGLQAGDRLRLQGHLLEDESPGPGRGVRRLDVGVESIEIAKVKGEES